MSSVGDVYLVCSGGCGVVAPIMVGSGSRCLGCGSPVAIASRPDVVRSILDRAGTAFTDEERSALEQLATDAARLKEATPHDITGADGAHALARAQEKMAAIMELRDALLPNHTEKLLRR